MLLFALMSVLLLVIAGLAIDAGMSYFSSDQVERAAAAGALAGVAYLPGDFSGARTLRWSRWRATTSRAPAPPPPLPLNSHPPPRRA